MIRVVCRGGAEFTGQSVESICRRKFGRGAVYVPTQNPNTVEVGQILKPTKHNPREYWVLAVVLRIEELS